MQPPNIPSNEQSLSQLMDGEWHDLNPSESVAQICNDASLRGKWARYHLIRDSIKGEQVQTDSAMVSRICAAIANEPEYSNITPFTPAGSGAQRGVDAHIQHADTDLNAPVVPVTPIAAQVQASTSGSASASRNSSWLSTGAAGFGLAASVALVTVLGMNVWQGQSNLSESPETVANQTLSGGGGDNVFASQLEGSPLPVVEFVANTGSYWVSPQTAERVVNEDKLNMFLTQHIENAPSSLREGMLPYSRIVGYDEQVNER